MFVTERLIFYCDNIPCKIIHAMHHELSYICIYQLSYAASLFIEVCLFSIKYCILLEYINHSIRPDSILCQTNACTEKDDRIDFLLSTTREVIELLIEIR